MATGFLPFKGDRSAAVFDANLHRAPVAPVRLNGDLPHELERVMNKAIERDRDLRYQHASDICTDLLRLKRETSSGRASVVPTAEGVEASSPASPAKPSGGGRRAASGSGSVPADPDLAPPSGWPKKIIFLTAGIVALRLFSGWGYVHFFNRPKLADKDSIVLAEFDKKTGDRAFDDTLKQALAAELAQSPFLNFLSDQKAAETRKNRGKQPTDYITRDGAQEI